MSESNNIEVSGDIQLEAVKQVGEFGLRITDLGVAATIMAIILLAIYLIARQVMKSLDERAQKRDAEHAEERKSWQEKDQKKAEMMLQVISENSASNKEASLATQSLERTIMSIERERFSYEQKRARSQQQSSSPSQPTPFSRRAQDDPSHS